MTDVATDAQTKLDPIQASLLKVVFATRNHPGIGSSMGQLHDIETRNSSVPSQDKGGLDRPYHNYIGGLDEAYKKP